ncbi:sigma 54-interacting response regulator [Mucilaginibacter agri]|uniref:Response regulator n=1 Tax=Mucilaginibacter agri TaxID=2695265 RepID=A0A965ZML5_9SPHI|nr:sigma 54-interacting response regulator [Mucilaginibacter agri]NCD72481.1 response regulator [Mucilaginibacter agri]
MSSKILIVEDEFVVANALRLALRQAGHIINGIAISTDAAEEALRKQETDLVLLDIRLNGKQTGIDLARKLRADHIAFIFISANSSQKILEEAKTTEPYGFIVKPFREKDLLVAVDIALYRHKHSLESQLRQEELLRSILNELYHEETNLKEKLIKTARAIQPHIPFDLIALSFAPQAASSNKYMGYLHIGFDEYQFIEDEELINITDSESEVFFSESENNDIKTSAEIYRSKVSEDSGIISPSPKMLFDRFKIASCMRFPIVTNAGLIAKYFFYSRQQDHYTQNHIALLNRLKRPLVEVTEKMLSGAAPSSAINISHPLIVHPSPTTSDPEFKTIIGNHPLLLAALDLIKQVAPYNTSVLILGESGTGKEKVAQSIHSLSTRKNGPFIKVNCAAIPAALIESELFGHEKGAFTGAVEKRKGKFEQADGGTIFLDEIGELPLDMQMKLLRVLQEKEIDHIGGNTTKKVDVRIVAATNRILEKEIAAGNFRVDLYYRLNVFPITLPPLRERKSDIKALALYFANWYCREFNKEFAGISSSMLEELHAYDWPGNIRELENAIERAVILNDNTSKLELRQPFTGNASLPIETAAIETLDDVKLIQQETERQYIISILKKTEGRIRGAQGAAELLNIKPTTLESKMAKLGIKRNDFMPWTKTL